MPKGLSRIVRGHLVKARAAHQSSAGLAPEEEQRQPETYEVLIQCLRHSKLAVRELARWHLARLAPEGKDIHYDAGAPAEERARAYEQWQALIPAGQLPPHRGNNPPHGRNVVVVGRCGRVVVVLVEVVVVVVGA